MLAATSMHASGAHASSTSVCRLESPCRQISRSQFLISSRVAGYPAAAHAKSSSAGIHPSSRCKLPSPSVNNPSSPRPIAAAITSRHPSGHGEAVITAEFFRARVTASPSMVAGASTTSAHDTLHSVVNTSGICDPAIIAINKSVKTIPAGMSIHAGGPAPLVNSCVDRRYGSRRLMLGGLRCAGILPTNGTLRGPP